MGYGNDEFRVKQNAMAMTVGMLASGQYMVENEKGRSAVVKRGYEIALAYEEETERRYPSGVGSIEAEHRQLSGRLMMFSREEDTDPVGTLDRLLEELQTLRRGVQVPAPDSEA